MPRSIDPALLTIPRHVLNAVPAWVARKEGVLPVSVESDGTLVLASARPDEFAHKERLRAVCGRPVKLVRASRTSLMFAIRRHYGGHWDEETGSPPADV